MSPTRTVLVAAIALAVGACSDVNPTSPVGEEAQFALGSGGNGDHFYASSERFGYEGTVSVYDTWSDAKSGRNARCSDVVVPQRDGAIFVVRNAPEYYSDESNIILTNWFANNGSGNPSNTNVGFVQLYDENADTWQNQSAGWSKDQNTFTVRAQGRNATYGSPDPMDYARLWNACAPQGSGERTIGTFLTYDYELVATGLNGVEGDRHFFTNTTNASDYSGHFRGIFRNESNTSGESNGYYVFDFSINNTSWAADCDCGYGGPNANGGPTLPDEFGGRER